MPMDYRVTLDCGHTYEYRTMVHPQQREQLTCLECGPGQRAVTAELLAEDACFFEDFSAPVAVAATRGPAVPNGPAVSAA
jgi:hypothetical protein